MSLFARRAVGDTNTNLIPARSSGRVGSVSVTADTALNQSAVWAALRVRADMISTLPVDVFRKVGAEHIDVPKPPILIDPQGDGTGLREWMYSTQMDLDRVGNAFGLITAVDGAGKPREIQLVSHKNVVVAMRSGVVSYRIDGKTYPKESVWHERQFTIPGLPVGLSPVAYAAYSIGLYQSAQQFGLEWFANGGVVPSGHFKNVNKKLDPGESTVIKDRFKAAVASRDVLVTGSDWEYHPVASAERDAQFLQTQQMTEVDIARFFGVPGDVIDVMTNASNVTYANVVERNLQFLILNLQPVITRREEALSRLLAAPRFVKLNTSAILRMDPKTQAEVFQIEIASKTRTPDEVREKLNLPPLTDAQWAEFDRMTPNVTPGLVPTIGGK